MTPEVEQLSCQELVELVTSYFEGALAADVRAEFDRHLETCDGCREYLEQMRTTIALAGELRPSDLTPDAEDALLTAFRNWKAS